MTKTASALSYPEAHEDNRAIAPKELGATLPAAGAPVVQKAAPKAAKKAAR